MKKNILIILAVFAALLFVSCNSEPEHGLYYQLATSSEASTIEMSKFLLVDNSDYIYLNNEGIFNNKDCLAKSEKGTIIASAYAESADKIYYLDTNENLYSLIDSKINTLTEHSGKFCKLFEFGYLLGDKAEGIFYFENPDNIQCIYKKEVSNIATSNGYIAFSDSEHTYIYKGTTLIKTLKTRPYNGFLVVDENNIFFTETSVKKTDIYKVNGNEVDKFTDKAILLETQKNGIPLFEENGKIYLKFASVFVEFDIAEKITREITRDWADNLATANVIFAQDGYIATAKSGLFKINIKNNSNQRIY